MTTNTELMDSMIDANRCGYNDQMEWLKGKTVAEARQALDARRASLEPSEYNKGGNAATCDYIEMHS